MKTMFHLLGATILAAATSGCALLGKSDALVIRYFTPETTRPQLTSAPVSSPAPTPATLALRFSRVSSGKHLRDRMVYRDTAWELGFYEERRWTENPEVFVRHTLDMKLFERAGIQRVVSGTAPTLEVEVLAFDELRFAPARAGRVQLKIVLHDDHVVLLDETITVDKPVTSKSPEAAVAAISDALDAAGEQVAQRVKTVIAAHAAAAPPIER